MNKKVIRKNESLKQLAKLIKQAKEGYTGVFGPYQSFRVYSISGNIYPPIINPQDVEFDIYKGMNLVGFMIGQKVFGIGKDFRHTLDILNISNHH